MRWSESFFLDEGYEEHPLRFFKRRAKETLKSIFCYMVDNVSMTPEVPEKILGLTPWGEGCLSFDVHVELVASGFQFLWALDIKEPVNLMPVIPSLFLPLSEESKERVLMEWIEANITKKEEMRRLREDWTYSQELLQRVESWWARKEQAEAKL